MCIRDRFRTKFIGKILNVIVEEIKNGYIIGHDQYYIRHTIKHSLNKEEANLLIGQEITVKSEILDVESLDGMVSYLRIENSD